MTAKPTFTGLPESSHGPSPSLQPPGEPDLLGSVAHGTTWRSAAFRCCDLRADVNAAFRAAAAGVPNAGAPTGAAAGDSAGAAPAVGLAAGAEGATTEGVADGTTTALTGLVT